MKHLVPPGAEERYLDTSRGRLRVLHGGAPTPGRLPVVLIHGGGTDNAGISWFRLFEPLARDREVWALDLPGFGGSMAAPAVGGPGPLANVVGEVLDAVGTSPVVAFGVSMGGDVALNLALERPDLVSGLVLIAPGGLVPIFRNRVVHASAWTATLIPDWLLLPMTRLANRFVGPALRAIVRDPAVLPPEVVQEFVREARVPDGGLAYGRYNQATIGRRAMLNDLGDRVHRLEVPTLFFHGVEDPMVDPDGSRRAAERMPAARLVMVPNCGHWAQLEAHDRFLAECRTFFAEMDDGGGKVR